MSEHGREGGAGASVDRAGETVAREVLRPDAAKLPPISLTAPAKGGDLMSTDPVSSGAIPQKSTVDPPAMMVGEREGLIARIRQVRRLANARDRPSSDAREPQPDRLHALETRVAHLEQELEGLQDSVHRETERQAKLIVELQTQIKPGAIGAALAQDARDRGL